MFGSYAEMLCISPLNKHILREMGRLFGAAGALRDDVSFRFKIELAESSKVTERVVGSSCWQNKKKLAPVVIRRRRRRGINKRIPNRGRTCPSYGKAGPRGPNGCSRWPFFFSIYR